MNLLLPDDYIKRARAGWGTFRSYSSSTSYPPNWLSFQLVSEAVNVFYYLRVRSDGSVEGMAVGITSNFLMLALLLVSKLVISGSGIFKSRSI